MNKKFLLVVLSLLLIVTLAGCKKDTTTTINKTKPVTTAEHLINVSEQNFDKNNPKDITFDISNVTEISLDGNKLNSNQVNIESNKISIKKEFLNELNNDYYNFKLSGSDKEYVRVYVVGSNANSFEDIGFYDNKAYRDYGGNIATITEQWIKYGIGDPYIMRFNGVYYLYVPTKDSEMGLKAWKSLNLVDWVPCQGEGLELSFVSMDPITNHAYPIGMFYYDGTFYMSTSPYGKGHYILTSKSPEGPFVAFDNINHKLDIDGRFFVDDDEQVYFVSTADAWNKGIRMTKVSIINNQMVFNNEVYIKNSIIHPWTEGPDLFKRDGKYYLTFTGSCVVSEGYRISYAVADSMEDFFANNFKEPDNIPLILACDNNDAFEGLGHNGVVMGPDMDSYYIVYHNLNNISGPNRSLNIDRLFFNGSEMTSIFKSEKSVKPTLPRYYTYSKDYGFTHTDDLYLSTESTNSSYNAEFNLKGSNVKLVYGYIDSNNYNYVKVADNIIHLYKKVNGNESIIASGVLNKEYDLDNNLYSIRVQTNSEKTEVYFNNLRKIESDEPSRGGRIGYLGGNNLEIGYTAFSDVSFGESDQKEIKQASFLITANTYLNNNTYSSINGNLLRDGSGIKKINNRHYDGAYELVLNNLFDYATYLVNFDEDGYYGLEFTLNKKYLGKQVSVYIDNENYVFNINELTLTDTKEDYVTLLVDSMYLKKGIHRVKISNWSNGPFGFVQFRFVSITDEEVEKTINKNNLPLIGQTAKVYYLDTNQYTDFTISVDIMFNSAPENDKSAGILFRSNNLSMYQSPKHDSEDYTSVQGYYVSFGDVAKLERLNYWTTKTLFSTDYTYPRGEFFNVKVEVKSNKIKVFVDDELIYEFVDSLAFTHGKVGIYVNDADVKFQNIVFNNK